MIGCILNIGCDNIYIENVQFIQHDDGSITLPSSVLIKICDFGVAEIFNSNAPNNCFQFKCDKHGLNIDNEAYHAPEIVDGIAYNASKADMWSLGMIFYRLLTGKQLYDAQDIIATQCNNDNQNGYWALHHNRLKKYLKISGLQKYFGVESYALLCALLAINEEDRASVTECIGNIYFKSYYNKYYDGLKTKIDDIIQEISIQREYISKSLYYTTQA